ncbi:MAG TPA: lysylphosphatidylglycerol synthase transmembrane domain-containing protein [Candidatus Saccharimonadales bacterium]|nr:lysylphosphatidylglycerol synthase transmembrane domain-containing protein [Candidatus Saccharimonadales bacterium]
MTTETTATGWRVRMTPHRVWIGFRGHWVTVVGVGAVIGLVFAVNPGKVAGALTHASPALLLIMLPVVLSLYGIRGITWFVVVRASGQPVGLAQALRVTLISQMFVFLPGGDLWKVPLVKQEDGSATDAGVITGTIVFDDLVYLFVLTFAMVPVVVATPVLSIPLAVALLPQVVIFAILLSPAVYRALSARVGNLRPFRRFRPELELLGPSFRSLVRVRTVLLVMALDVIAASLAIALFALALASVHATGSDLSHVAFTYSASQVVTNLTVIPGALGAYEGMMTGAMALEGVAPAAAATGTLLYRIANDVVMALIGVAIVLVYDRDRLGAIGRAGRSSG